jgi:hypothetical protein
MSLDIILIISASPVAAAFSIKAARIRMSHRARTALAHRRMDSRDRAPVIPAPLAPGLLAMRGECRSLKGFLECRAGRGFYRVYWKTTVLFP